MKRHILVDGVRLNVYTATIDHTKPYIVFLHDSLGCITLWRNFPDILAQAAQCNVMVYDRQGYGESDAFTTIERHNDYLEKEAQTLDSLLAMLAIDAAILFGHSDGGSIALLTAAMFPERIKAVITEGAHVFVEDITLNGIRAAVEAYATTNLKEKLLKYHGDNVDGLFRAWTETWLSDRFRSWNIEKYLPNITCPVLVLQGENDEFGSTKQVSAITEQVSGRAQQCLIPAVGHSPHKENPEQTLEPVIRFLQSLQS